MVRADIWLVTGAQGSGKTTVADLLASSFERGVHVRGGQFYRWAVTGWLPFDDGDRPEEARRLLELRYRLSGQVAESYAAAGFTTVVQDNIYASDVVAWLRSASRGTTRLVVLRPSVAALAARDLVRRRATGKVAYRGRFTPKINDEQVAATPRRLGLWLDTSSQSPEQTVGEIVARSSEAVIDEGVLASVASPTGP